MMADTSAPVPFRSCAKTLRMCSRVKPPINWLPRACNWRMLMSASRVTWFNSIEPEVICNSKTRNSNRYSGPHRGLCAYQRGRGNLPREK